MVYFAFDNPADQDKMAFIINNKLNIKTFFPAKKLNSSKEMIKFNKYILSKTIDNDIVIFWYDFMGVLFEHLSRLNRKKRKIIILNILLKKKKTIKNKLAKILYRKSLIKSNVLSTVTSFEYGQYIADYLKIKNNFKLLRDPYHIVDNINSNDESYLFCGGRNGRDWDFIFDVANTLKDINFHFVLSKDDYLKFKDKKSNNIKIMHDISLEEFEKELKSSMFLTIPLNTDSPAGLLAFYQAAQFEKCIMTSTNIVAKEYLSNDKGICLDKDVSIWVKAIKELIEQPNTRKKLALNFKRYLETECNEIMYLNEINNLIKIMKVEENNYGRN